MLNYTDAIRIYWPVKKISEISFEPHETAFEVINKFLTSQIYTPANQNVTSAGGLHHPPNVHRVAGSSKYVYTFALRLICRDLNPNEHYWLHPKQNLREYVEHNLSLLEKGWKFELRIRYVPASLENMYQEDFLAFKFLYEQVLQDYLWLDISVKSLCSNQDWIIELACLEIRRINPHLTPQALEKKSNFETIEAEMDKYFPIKLKSLVKVFLKFLFAIVFNLHFVFTVQNSAKADIVAVQEDLPIPSRGCNALLYETGRSRDQVSARILSMLPWGKLNS